jgi:hypothetical protein
MGGRRTGHVVVALGLALLLVVIALLLHHALSGTEHASPVSDPTSSAVEADSPPSGDDQTPELPQPESRDIESLAAADAASARDTSLRVRVTWAADGTPAGDFSLQIVCWDIAEARRYARLVRTDARGEWFGSPMPPGRITAYTLVGPSKTATVASGDAAEIELQIPVGVTVNGLVTDAQGTAVGGADIWLSEPGNMQHGAVVARADERGRFVLRGLVPSSEKYEVPGHYLVARSEAHAPSGRTPLLGKRGETVEITLVVGGSCGTVRGTVLDSRHAAVAGALVRIGNQLLRMASPASGTLPTSAFEAITDEAGVFVVAGVPVGRLPVTGVAAGHSPVETSCDVKSGDNELELVLPESARIAGTVRDARGRPLAGATVWIEPHYELLGSDTTSGADGGYELRDVAVGLRQVHATEQDHGRDDRAVEVMAGADLVCDLSLGAGASLSGVLLDTDDKPAPGWLVRATSQLPGNSRFDSSADKPVMARSRADGSFRLTNVPAGEQRLLLTGKTLGNVQRLLAEHLQPGTSDLVLHLPPDVDKTGSLSCRFVDAQGQPLSGVRATPQLVETQEKWVPLASDEAGRVLAEDLPLTSWTMTAQADGYPATSFGPFDVGAGPATDVGDLVLERGGTLLVRLQADAPLDQGWIRGHLRSENGISGASGKLEGALLRFPPCAPGPGEVSIDARDFVAQRQKVELKAGEETTIDVRLVSGIRQRLRAWVPAAPDQSASDTHFRYVLRDATGAVVVERDINLPMREGAFLDPSLPFFEGSETVAPGTYSVDVTVNEVSRTGLLFTATPDAPWDVDLR